MSAVLEAVENFSQKRHNAFYFFGRAGTHCLIHQPVKLRMKAHMAAVCSSCLFCAKNVEPVILRGSLALYARPLRSSLRSSSETLSLVTPRHSASPPTCTPSLFWIAMMVDFSHVDIHIGAKFTALAFYLLKARHDAQQGVTDRRAARPVGGPGLRVLSMDFCMLSSTVCFLCRLFSGTLVWYPYIFVNPCLCGPTPGRGELFPALATRGRLA